MIQYEMNDRRDGEQKHLGFLTANDNERDLYLHCKVYVCSNGELNLEKFMFGSVGEYEFQCYDWQYDTLLFKGKGRGRKPETAERAMRDFVKEVQREVNGKKIEEIHQLKQREE